MRLLEKYKDLYEKDFAQYLKDLLENMPEKGEVGEIGADAEYDAEEKEQSKELAEQVSCPIATQDIKTNLANRQTAVDDANYGPANPNEPN